MGLSMASIFLTFTGVSIARTFFVTAAAFGALSLYGYVTKRDLTKLGGLIVARRPDGLVAMPAPGLSGYQRTRARPSRSLSRRSR